MNAICVADYEKYSRHHDEDLPSFKIAATRSFPSRLTCSLSILWKSSNLIEFISTTVTHIVQKNICFLNHEFCCIQKRGGGSKGFIIEMCLMTTNWEHVLQWSNLVFHKIIKKKQHQMWNFASHSFSQFVRTALQASQWSNNKKAKLWWKPGFVFSILPFVCFFWLTDPVLRLLVSSRYPQLKRKGDSKDISSKKHDSFFVFLYYITNI